MKKYFLPVLNSSKIMKSLVDDMRDYSKILGK